MKLILCTKCHDVFKLSKRERSCGCGACVGAYEPDGWHAWFRGTAAVPLGILNQSLTSAVVAQKLLGPIAPTESDIEYPNLCFTAFVFPEGHERVERRDET